MKMILSRFGFAKTMLAALAITVFLTLATPLSATDPPGPAITFDNLTVRGTIYTRVVIVDVSKRHVSFKSAQGFSTVLIDDLGAEAQTRIGRGRLDSSNATKAQPAPAAEAASKATPAKAREQPAERDDADEKAEETDSAVDPFQWTILSMGSIGMMGLGVLTLLVGQIWLIVVAFRTSTGWGIALVAGTFVIGIITSMFCRAHWDVAKRPVVVKLIGAAMTMGGYFLFGR